MLDLFNPLVTVSLCPLLGVFLLGILPTTSISLCRLIALCNSCLTFILSLLLWLCYNENSVTMQFCVSYNWVHSLNLHYTMGIDGISLFFIILTTFLILLCILVSWESIKIYVKEYLISFLILEFFFDSSISVLDLFLFYLYFESVLMPMFLIIGIWGSRSRKVRAAYQFFLYTLIGSLLMLVSLVAIYFITGTTNILVLNSFEFTETQQVYFWLAFFASFAVKIPMVPFHIWLPEAHAEAPTAGSVILAGILLKLGGYGFLRFSLPFFPIASIYFSPLIFLLSIMAALYASLTTLRQIDLKKIIAYSSVAHMSFVTIGIFSFNHQGIEGSILLMLSHGLVSSALFLSVGVLYDRHKTRLIKYYSGLTQVMPIYMCYLLFFSFANIGFPGTSSFVGELLVILGSFQLNILMTLCICISIILSAAYSIWLLNRIGFGTLRVDYFNNFQDISRREFWIFNPLIFIILWMGISPNFFSWYNAFTRKYFIRTIFKNIKFLCIIDDC
uniref:NADH-ubiquinone oxidoreductase chain 4 n=1 Tax=Neogoniolithon spectabile TaxID=231755 RepID=A0A3G3MIP3_9FLOR|nr:NADH dehydrogenase subunit 4 [Neogoniolithon spectabile]AYR06665.1 NADH dehydrogenase subunit 4 [Neogoniolithon spectabile]